MKLTATQRTFISDQLGVKARTKKTLHLRSTAEKKDDAISGALDDYMRRESKVLESLTALERVAGTATLMAAFENEVQQIQDKVKRAVREGAEEVLKTAYKELEDIKKRASKEAETGEKNPTFFALRAAADAALKKLESHPQRAHVQAKITEGRTALNEAVAANDKKRYPESLTKLETARLAAVAGKDMADKFNAYRVARAPTATLLATMDGQYNDQTVWDGFSAKLAAADLKATVAAQKYAEATSAVGTIKTQMGATLKGWTENTLRTRITELEQVTQLPFVAADLKQLKDWLAEVPGKIAAEEWGGMAVLTTRALEFRVAATDRATRRQAYLDARQKATDAIAVLKPNTGMAAKVLEFETVLTATADPLATAAAQRFEEAIALCDKVVKDCGAQAATAAAAKKFLDDRKALDQRLVTLKALPAAAQMVDAMGSLQGLLAEADKRVLPGVLDWAGGQEWLTRLQADLTAAEALAVNLKGAMAAQEAVKAAGKPEDVTKAVEQLRAEALKLDVVPYKALLASELKGIADGCKLALEKGKAGELDAAKQALTGAADLVVKATNTQALQKNFDEALALADKRRQDLAELAKTGSCTAIVPKVNLIQPLLDQARQAAKTGAYPAAMAALAQANAAAHVADEAVEGIKAYDLHAGPLATRCKTMKTGGDTVTAVEKLLADAGLAAAGLRFADARKLQDQAEARMEELKIKRLAKANPDDADIATAAEALLKLDGGAKMIDDFVKTLDGDISFDLIAKLAEKRFGIVLTSDAGSKTLSAKEIWNVMATVPASHATKNPSLKSVKREKPDDGSSGAFNWYSKSMEMNGRPDDLGTEKFDKATREKALGLPQDHDTQADPYAPVDDKPANLFSMTVLHEVGHAVDDRLGFMAGREGQAAFGGWVQYTDLGLIADAVATAKKYDRAYVLQLLNGGSPDPVLMQDDHEGGEVKWEKAKKAVDDWYALVKHGQIWYDYAESKAAAINGVVYQEAYPNNWVSYVLAERAKGITAYQWRAPGEWFAELYMCWYGKKLKDNHPFAPWLKTL